MVPRATNPLYTGREELGKLLTQRFSYNPSAPPKQQRTFVIYNIGSAGKSEVCLEFAKDHRDKYVTNALKLKTR